MSGPRMGRELQGLIGEGPQGAPHNFWHLEH